jgi:hypothetical protein
MHIKHYFTRLSTNETTAAIGTAIASSFLDPGHSLQSVDPLFKNSKNH